MPEHWNDTASTMVRYTRAKGSTSRTIYAIALSGFGSAPLPQDGKLALACVEPDASSKIQLLGYKSEMTRQLLDIQWEKDAKTGNAIVSIPVDLDKHPSVMVPGFVFKIQGTPKSCKSEEAHQAAVII